MKNKMPAATLPKLQALGFLLLTVSFAFAQKENQPSEQSKSSYAELTKAPEKALAKVNAFEGSPEAVAAGRKLFVQHCAQCHGNLAGGTRKGPSLLANEVQQAAPGALFWVLTNGAVRRGMPVWSKLPEPQRWQIVTYVKSLGTQPPPPAVHNPE
jgi:mono/diheme cytochrome c family protein